MENKYDNVKLENISAEGLLKAIKDELDVVLLHIDLLKAITSSDCLTLILHDVFKEICMAFNTITRIENDTYVELDNRFQKRPTP